MALAMGDEVRRERNQRAPSMASTNGRMNTPMPKNCSTRSEAMAPAMPIQLRAACELVSEDALLNDGSSGEYDASARNRRTAETISKNPISSLSGRLLVGTRALERYLIGAGHTSVMAPLQPQPKTHLHPCASHYARARRLCQKPSSGEGNILRLVTS